MSNPLPRLLTIYYICFINSIFFFTDFLSFYLYIYLSMQDVFLHLNVIMPTK